MKSTEMCTQMFFETISSHLAVAFSKTLSKLTAFIIRVLQVTRILLFCVMTVRFDSVEWTMQCFVLKSGL